MANPSLAGRMQKWLAWAAGSPNGLGRETVQMPPDASAVVRCAMPHAGPAVTVAAWVAAVRVRIAAAAVMAAASLRAGAQFICRSPFPVSKVEPGRPPGAIKRPAGA